ncbi:hypothetical protein CF640_37205 [Burkholderia pseudomallei]|nr:hypothetical protein CF640_37205 [Burkholderia pseudomallei]
MTVRWWGRGELVVAAVDCLLRHPVSAEALDAARGALRTSAVVCARLVANDSGPVVNRFRAQVYVGQVERIRVETARRR